MDEPFSEDWFDFSEFINWDQAADDDPSSASVPTNTTTAGREAWRRELLLSVNEVADAVSPSLMSWLPQSKKLDYNSPFAPSASRWPATISDSVRDEAIKIFGIARGLLTNELIKVSMALGKNAPVDWSNLISRLDTLAADTEKVIQHIHFISSIFMERAILARIEFLKIRLAKQYSEKGYSFDGVHVGISQQAATEYLRLVKEAKEEVEKGNIPAAEDLDAVLERLTEDPLLNPVRMELPEQPVISPHRLYSESFVPYSNLENLQYEASPRTAPPNPQHTVKSAEAVHPASDSDTSELDEEEKPSPIIQYHRGVAQSIQRGFRDAHERASYLKIKESERRVAGVVLADPPDETTLGSAKLTKEAPPTPKLLAPAFLEVPRTSQRNFTDLPPPACDGPLMLSNINPLPGFNSQSSFSTLTTNLPKEWEGKRPLRPATFHKVYRMQEQHGSATSDGRRISHRLTGNNVAWNSALRPGPIKSIQDPKYPGIRHDGETLFDSNGRPIPELPTTSRNRTTNTINAEKRPKSTPFKDSQPNVDEDQTEDEVITVEKRRATKKSTPAKRKRAVPTEPETENVDENKPKRAKKTKTATPRPRAQVAQKVPRKNLQVGGKQPRKEFRQAPFAPQLASPPGRSTEAQRVSSSNTGTEKMAPSAVRPSTSPKATIMPKAVKRSFPTPTEDSEASSPKPAVGRRLASSNEQPDLDAESPPVPKAPAPKYGYITSGGERHAVRGMEFTLPMVNGRIQD